MKPKLLLINPWQTYDKKLESEYQSYIPYGLACIASIGLKEGFETKIVDCLEDETKNYYEDKVVFGKTSQEVKSIIENFKPDIVGISSSFSMFEKDATDVAKLVKTINKDIVVILGGVTATLKEVYEPLLHLGVYDIMSRGEGEETFADLLKNYNTETKQIDNLSNIKGIAYLSNGDVTITEDREFICDLGKLPFPALDLLNIDKILSNKYYSRWRNNPVDKRSMPIFTSRGCPYNCIFCSVHSQVGYKFRKYPIDYVLTLMKYCIEKYKINHFHFEDDNLTLDKERAKELFKRVKDLNITWDTPNGVRADTIDEELLTIMKESGLTSLSIAAESGNEHVRLDIIKKRLKTKSLVDTMQLCDKLEVPCIVFFVVGFPGEKLEEIKDTINFAKEITCKYKTINTIYVANPLPGTELSKIASEKGYIKKKLTNADYFEAIRINKNSIIETEEFTKRRIFELLKKELPKNKFSLHNPSMPMFWVDDEMAWHRAKQAFPKISNREFVWEWKDEI